MNALEGSIQERGPRNFEKAVTEGIQTAFRRIRERFEDNREDDPNGWRRLAAHNVLHTERVVERTGIILEAIRTAAPEMVSERTIALGQLAAAWHDTVQEFQPVTEKTSDGRTKLVRKRVVPGKIEQGDNERASAEELLAYMDLPENRELFTDQDRELVRAAIMHTVPTFAGGTVVQPITPESSVIARAVALADLGGAGMAGFEEYRHEGDALFREENIDITDALTKGVPLTPEDETFYKERMLAWSAFQEPFAKGRKARFEKEVEGLPKEAADAVGAHFTKFDDTIDKIRKLHEERLEMAFPELARSMGYFVPDARTHA